MDPRDGERSAGEAEHAAALSDEDLFLRFRDHRDRAALDELVHRHERSLYGYLRQYLRDADLAQDVFQATFVQLYRKRHLYEAGRPFRPWLYSIATRLGIDWTRRRERRFAYSLDRPGPAEQPGAENLVDMLEAEAPGPLANAEREEQRQWLHRAVAKLPEHQRVVIQSVFFEGKKYSEAAEALHLPLGTVKSRMNKALSALHDAWERVSEPRPAAAEPPASTGAAPPVTTEPEPPPCVRHILASLDGQDAPESVPDGLAKHTCTSLAELENHPENQ